MRRMHINVSLVVVLFAFLTNCQKVPTSIENHSNSPNSEIAKKPSKPGDPKVKYSCTLEAIPSIFTIVNNHPPDDCDAYKPYLNPPAGLEPDSYTTFRLSATSLSTKDWFNAIAIGISSDLDGNGIPDEDGRMVVYIYKIGDGKYYNFPKQDFFYWWGQKRIYNYPDECYNISDTKKGQYLAKILLRSIPLKGADKGVYSSEDDPNFPTFPNIQQGYIPIIIQ
jgi:hypothetical protein